MIITRTGQTIWDTKNWEWFYAFINVAVSAHVDQRCSGTTAPEAKGGHLISRSQQIDLQQSLFTWSDVTNWSTVQTCLASNSFLSFNLKRGRLAYYTWQLWHHDTAMHRSTVSMSTTSVSTNSPTWRVFPDSPEIIDSNMCIILVKVIALVVWPPRVL